ncbi:MAG: hypothetical protein ACI39U_06755 [Candidatus Cryptobacteroides sp.]
MRYRLIFISLLLAVLSACTKEVLQEEMTVGETVTVSLKFTESPVISGYGSTKAIDEPDLGEITTLDHIKNLCILQYNGTGDDATLVGDVHYLTENNPDENKGLDFDRINLVASADAVHTLVFFTNTFAKLAKFTTLGALKEATKNISSQEDLFGYDSTVAPTEDEFPDNRTYYQRLNGFTQTVVKQDTPITCNLKRSIAKIKVVIDNDGTDNLKILSVQLKNIPKTARYFTNYTGFQDSFDPKRPQRLDYPVRNMSDVSGGAQNETMEWYMPSNMRGVDASNSLEERKNTSKNAEGATCVQINALYSDDETPIAYTFYLGGNLVNDFNIEPNKAYTYTFKFRGKGDASVDNRIEDMSAYDFMYDSNCYMLTPPPFASRSYTFNVVHRPNVFWGTSSEDRYGMKADYPNNEVTQASTWNAKILWSDFNMTQEEANAFLSVKQGTGAGSYMDATQRVKVTVPAGCEGNVVIGMYKNQETDILWSWHLWITSYVPDKCVSISPATGQYVYAVTGGEIHRYGGSSWTGSGKYASGFAMDRNLGAKGQNNYQDNVGRGMGYQFGRKDPFPGTYTVYKYDADGNSTAVSDMPKTDAKSVDAIAAGNKNVPYSINNPTGMILCEDGQAWTTNDIFHPNLGTSVVNEMVWNDPNIEDGSYSSYTDYDEKYSATGKTIAKSIFDPCPPGWTVPELEAVADFENKTSWESDYGKGTGRTYFPEGTVGDLNAQTVFFPNDGMRAYKAGSLGSVNNGFYWCSVSAYWKRGQDFQFGASIMEHIYNTHVGYAISVRCVTE